MGSKRHYLYMVFGMATKNVAANLQTWLSGEEIAMNRRDDRPDESNQPTNVAPTLSDGAVKRQMVREPHHPIRRAAKGDLWSVRGIVRSAASQSE
jgi:hypothetical protein